jgi:hypothetical protein
MARAPFKVACIMLGTFGRQTGPSVNATDSTGGWVPSEELTQNLRFSNHLAFSTVQQILLG